MQSGLYFCMLHYDSGLFQDWRLVVEWECYRNQIQKIMKQNIEDSLIICLIILRDKTIFPTFVLIVVRQRDEVAHAEPSKGHGHRINLVVM